MEWLSDTHYVVDEHGCWIWQLARNNKGYGLKWDPDRRRLMVAHRLYYERAYGPIPAGLQIDHLCRVRACVNPAHLEAVDPQRHGQRSVAYKPRKPAQIRERPEARRVDPAECVLWQGCRDRDGYGARSVNGKRVFVHRWVYEQVHGPIPPGMTVDHLCRNPACYNLDHLEAVSRADNNRRATWRHSCKYGHLMTPENTLWESSGQRRCRTCRTETRERSKQRRKQQRQR